MAREEEKVKSNICYDSRGRKSEMYLLLWLGNIVTEEKEEMKGIVRHDLAILF